jgi:hypothetical protein
MGISLVDGDMLNYQEGFISDMRKYDRSLLYELWDCGFVKAKLFFGDSGLDFDGGDVGLYRTRRNGDSLYCRYDSVGHYKYHLMCMILSDSWIGYLEDYHKKCLDIFDSLDK